MDKFLYIRNNGYRSIHENDYRVFQRFNLTMMYEYDVMLDDTLWPCEIDVEEDENNETRITFLKVPKLDYNARLPAELTGLSALRILKAARTGIGSIPTSIGLLKNLQELDLSSNHIEHLPREIGLLTKLQKLNLAQNPISSLPSTIGRLQKLTYLSVSSTKLSTFPDEFWNLTSLNQLCATDMDYYRRNHRRLRLHTSIERLQNLVQLHIGSNGVLDNLPDEIGNLPKLEVLLLKGPKGIKLLRTLKNLNNLTVLELQSRTKIDVEDLDVIRLIPNLSHFSFLRSKEDLVLEYTLDERNRFCQMVQQSRYLGVVDLVLEAHIPCLPYALACNRFRSCVHGKNPFYGKGNAQELLLQKLWPTIIVNATIPFRPWNTRQEPIAIHDAVYTLLNRGRGSFLQVLYHRKSKRTETVVY